MPFIAYKIFFDHEPSRKTRQIFVTLFFDSTSHPVGLLFFPPLFALVLCLLLSSASPNLLHRLCVCRLVYLSLLIEMLPSPPKSPFLTVLFLCWLSMAYALVSLDTFHTTVPILPCSCLPPRYSASSNRGLSGMFSAIGFEVLLFRSYFYCAQMPYSCTGFLSRNSYARKAPRHSSTRLIWVIAHTIEVLLFIIVRIVSHFLCPSLVWVWFFAPCICTRYDDLLQHCVACTPYFIVFTIPLWRVHPVWKKDVGLR